MVNSSGDRKRPQSGVDVTKGTIEKGGFVPGGMQTPLPQSLHPQGGNDKSKQKTGGN